MTLDDLTAKLNKDRFYVKRSTVYTRFQPKLSNSIQGKRHVDTVPIKAENDHHAKHPDELFRTTTIKRLEEVASILGQDKLSSSILTVDQKIIDVATHQFLKHNLDILFVATNAPGSSAYNRVERKMAPLSRELSGSILDHCHFGSHLDSAGKTLS
ncbi:hypothetical protein DAPPUDRAFT_245554 [Daphnia pulex]|uniref:Uncharacterized protein n=1 Tax=Daphnia pulex TaxID=6669 RepID=E9GNK8_DAPPU|nr:hypothetical protein DAPPUDRAFT_245554 [Daphnia pulex]|eukprot:EFX78945.1 hypothetical protein DAPPUDRAFT_245554 [Daphnia pulex]